LKRKSVHHPRELKDVWTKRAKNVTHQLITDTNVLNTKVDNLTATLEGLTLNDDLEQHIDQQLAGEI
jgi:hypothetical protein